MTGTTLHIGSRDSDPVQAGVLLADDEPGITKVFHYILREALGGCRVDAVEDGRRAVELFRKHHHAVVILDLHMPEMDGVEAFQAIREDCAEEGLPMPCVVFFSGYAPPSSLVPVLESDDGHRFLPKPVSGSKLVEVVRSRLDRQGELREQAVDA